LLTPDAALDVDYHHGKGKQTCFYERSDVPAVSTRGRWAWHKSY
jgi:acetoin utilization deacetylase AcuC-like enzyme